VSCADRPAKSRHSTTRARRDPLLLERDVALAAAALGSRASARVRDHDPAYRDRAYREDVTAVLPVGLRLVDQAQIRLVDQASRVRRLPDPVPTRLRARDPPEIVADQWHEPVERLPVPTPERDQQPCDVTLTRHPPPPKGSSLLFHIYARTDPSSSGAST
jgi:hypothetical protein